jgi:hypothetical protein
MAIIILLIFPLSLRDILSTCQFKDFLLIKEVPYYVDYMTTGPGNVVR